MKTILLAILICMSTLAYSQCGVFFIGETRTTIKASIKECPTFDLTYEHTLGIAVRVDSAKRANLLIYFVQDTCDMIVSFISEEETAGYRYSFNSPQYVAVNDSVWINRANTYSLKLMYDTEYKSNVLFQQALDQ